MWFQCPFIILYRTVDSLNQIDGVVAYIDNALVVSCIQQILGGVVNCFALTFNLQGHPCELIASYRSPSSNLSLFQQMVLMTAIKTIAMVCNYFQTTFIIDLRLGLEQNQYVDVLGEDGFITCVDIGPRLARCCRYQW